MPEPPERNTEPVDYLGRIGNAMLDEMRARVGNDDEVRAVIFLENEERCCTVLGGWEDDIEAVAAVLAHLARVFEANGKKLMVVPIGQG
jgi:hypothetical protein